jgi:ectoine hydroxylase
MKLSAQQLADFETRGYVTVPALFSPEEVRVLKAALEDVKRRTDRPEVVRERTNDAVRLIYGAHRFDEVFRRLVHHPRWIEPARQLLGGDIYLHQLRINPKAAFDGQGWWWHQDYATWRFEDGMPSPRALMIGVFLDDMTAANGPLMVIPGSQRHGHIEDTSPDQDATGYTVMDLPKTLIAQLVRDGGIEAVTGPAGTVLFMHCNLVHGSVGNITPFERTIAYLNVASCENRTTKHDRAPWFCNRDFSPLQTLGDDCLLVSSAAAVS